MHFCFMTALLMRWQVIPANFVVFCNQSNLCHPRGKNNTYDDIYGAVITAQSRLCFTWRMHNQRQMAANPQTKPNDLGHESAGRLLPSTSTIATVIITQPVGWCSFSRPTEGGRLSRPRQCSKGAQPVPKGDEHNRPRWDSNLGHLTPQSNVLT